MSGEILISVVTPCFNSAKTIRRTFDAMLRQTYRNIEYIVVDGGSTDGTVDIIREYEKKFPFTFRYISEPDQGIYNAMNKGIRMCNGELIGIINSDDYYQDDAIETMADIYDGQDYRIQYGFQRNWKNGEETQVFLCNHKQLRYMMVTHSTCFVTAKLYRDLGVFDETYKSAADYDFMIRVFKEKPDCFFPIYKIISNFEEGGISSTQTGVRETLKIRLKHGYIGKARYIIEILYSRLVELVQWLKRK